MRALLSVFLVVIIYLSSFSQDFPERCEGHWKGYMYMYKGDTLQDSLQVTLTVEGDTLPNTWIWKTVYHTDTTDIVKDYVLIYKENNEYDLDEKIGIVLKCYQYGNKLFSVFEVQGQLLTAIYELKDDMLIFEVTSGKKLHTDHETISSFSVGHMQRSVLYRQK